MQQIKLVFGPRHRPINRLNHQPAIGCLFPHSVEKKIRQTLSVYWRAWCTTIQCQLSAHSADRNNECQRVHQELQEGNPNLYTCVRKMSWTLLSIEFISLVQLVPIVRWHKWVRLFLYHVTTRQINVKCWFQWVEPSKHSLFVLSVRLWIGQKRVHHQTFQGTCSQSQLVVLSPLENRTNSV